MVCIRFQVAVLRAIGNVGLFLYLTESEMLGKLRMQMESRPSTLWSFGYGSRHPIEFPIQLACNPFNVAIHPTNGNCGGPGGRGNMLSALRSWVVTRLMSGVALTAPIKTF